MFTDFLLSNFEIFIFLSILFIIVAFILLFLLQLQNFRSNKNSIVEYAQRINTTSKEIKEYLVVVGNLLEHQKKEILNISEKIVFIEREINRLGNIKGSEDILNVAINMVRQGNSMEEIINKTGLREDEVEAIYTYYKIMNILYMFIDILIMNFEIFIFISILFIVVAFILLFLLQLQNFRSNKNSIIEYAESINNSSKEIKEYLIVVGNLLEHQKKEVLNISEKIVFMEREINRLGNIKGSEDVLNIAINMARQGNSKEEIVNKTGLREDEVEAIYTYYKK